MALVFADGRRFFCTRLGCVGVGGRGQDDALPHFEAHHFVLVGEVDHDAGWIFIALLDGFCRAVNPCSALAAATLHDAVDGE